MFKSEIAGEVFQVEFEKIAEQGGKLNHNPFQWDLVKTGPSTFHIVRNNRSFNVIVEGYDADSSVFQLKINGKPVEVKTLNRMQVLLQSMGLDAASSRKLNEIKAPMPGLVVRIPVQVGDSVKKGDSLLVLEAMKMENIIKAPGDAVVSKIHVNSAQAVEKNQLLISFS